ncbi:uncharacterized protein [Watersipora subatra]|uniref:uncharacterized protein n=1 Tax=Watersipora subatra TaxID=2589382 RepID=UPI00355B87F7
MYILSSMLLFSIITSASGQIEYYCSNSTISGDLNIAILVNNHYGSACDKAAPESAVNPLSDSIRLWTGTALPESLTIGLRVLDVCGDVDRASKLIHELVPWSSLYEDNVATDICTVSDSLVSVGMVSTVQPISYELTSLLQKASIPLVVAKNGYQNKVGPENRSTQVLGDSQETLTEILSKFLVALNWDFLTVVHSDDEAGLNSYEAFRSLSSKYYLCIDKVITVSSEQLDGKINTEGVVYLGSEGIGLRVLTLADLKDKTWVTTLNIKGLELRGPGRVYSVVRSGEDLVTQALKALGDAMSATINERNCNTDSITSCINSEFKSLFVRNTEKEIDELADVSYYAYLQPDDVKVATITLSGVTTELGFKKEPSLCDPTVTDCRDQCKHLQRNYLYIPGDWMIVMSLPIGKEIDPNNRWACIEYTDVGLFRAEAASYAFFALQNAFGNVRGQNTGLLVLDSCGDKLKTAGIVYDIVRGDLDSEICDTEDPTNCFNHTKIAVFIGDYSSAVTQKIQTILRDIPIIHMSYGASSVTLSDRTQFPYFLRTNPPDNIQTHYMVALLKRLRDDSKEPVNAVNIIYTDGLYGRTGAESVKEALSSTEICVHLEKKVNETRPNNFSVLVNDILQTTEDVKFIIVFLDTSHLDNLMVTIGLPQYRNSWLSQGFSFIFSDTWNDDPELLDKYGEIVKGSFSFKFNADFESENLASNLMNRDLPTVENVNPWLSTLEQEVGECKLRGNFMSEYSAPCELAQDLSAFAKESYSLHMIKALTTATVALQNLAFNHLNSNPNYLFDPDTITSRYDSFLRIEIPQLLQNKPKTHQPFTQKSADSDTYGNGKVGYTIYNINGDPDYVKIFETSYDPSVGLANSYIALPNFFKSNKVVGDITSFREQCFQSTDASGSPTTTAPSVPASIKTAVIIMGVALGLLIICLIAFCIIQRWRKERQNRSTAATTEGAYSEMCNYPENLSIEQLRGIRNYVSSPERATEAMDIHTDAGQSSHSYVSLQGKEATIPKPPDEEDPYMHPQNNAPIQGKDNAAFAPSEADDTVKISDSVSNASCTLSTSTASTRNTGVPTPAPRLSNSKESHSEDFLSQETCYV